MGGEDVIDFIDIDGLESFTSSVFDYSKLTSINEVRYLHFMSKCKPKEAAKPLDQNVNLCLFPPYKMMLMEQIKRSW